MSQNADGDGNGWPNTSGQGLNAIRAPDLLLETPKVTMHALICCTGVVHLNCTHGVEMGYRNVCARWEPIRGKEEYKNRHLENTLSHSQNSTEASEFMEFTIIGHNTWVHHFNPQTRETRNGNIFSDSPINSKDSSVQKNYVVCTPGCRRLPMLN